MKKLLFILFTLFFVSNIYSQISFKKGYFINNEGERIECEIKDLGWRNNPVQIKYRMSEGSKEEIEGIGTIQEFGIYDLNKYKRFTVLIDRSSDVLKTMGDGRAPEFNEETLFLKVLIEGKANLYYYENGSLKRFFFDTQNIGIEQLIYKRYFSYKDIKYKEDQKHVAYNKDYIFQLKTKLKCSGFPVEKYDLLEYKKADMIKFFSEYNSCLDSDFTNHNYREKDLFNLSFRPRINNSSFSIEYNIDNEKYYEFENQFSFGLGIEAEIILPQTNRKWALIIEPYFQYYKTEKSFPDKFVSGGVRNYSVVYNALDLPLGFRYYLYLDEKSKFFLDASYVICSDINSQIEITRDDGSLFKEMKINARNVFTLGAGYAFMDKYRIGIIYHTNGDLIEDYMFYGSDYKLISLVFSYSIF